MKKSLPVFILMLDFCPAQYLLPTGMYTLGSRSVNRIVDHDVIHVNRGKQFYRKLQLKVDGTALEIDRMAIHFKNGGVKTVTLRNRIPAGGYSRVIDLPGNKRGIDEVDFWYRAKGVKRLHSVVTLMGR